MWGIIWILSPPFFVHVPFFEGTHVDKQVLDAANCNMPDYYIHKATSCACGDDALRIPDDRRTESLEERAHWCTGTLRMNDGFGNPIYIYNPYSYDELLQLIGPPGTIDRYLLCISETNAGMQQQQQPEEQEVRCEKPTIAAIEEQSVSTISVIERCKSNYQQMQWDVGSFMLYDRENSPKALRTFLVPSFPDDDAVGSCLVRVQRNKESHLGCMREYLRLNYEISDAGKFFKYEKADPVLDPPDHTDACIVFSGPAKRTDNSTTTLEFQRCAHDYAEKGCMIPHMVWSSSSKNSVPVAKLHMVEEVSPTDRREHAMALFADAQDVAMKALRELQNFTDANLEVRSFFVCFAAAFSEAKSRDPASWSRWCSSPGRGMPSTRSLTAS